MTASEGKGYAVGARLCRVYELGTTGLPAAASPTVAYEGYQLAALKNFNLTSPDVRSITHYGDDRVLAKDFLPPNESGTGTIAVGRMDMDVYAAMMSTKEYTLGEAKVIGFGTSQRGYEADIAITAVQQMLDAVTKARRWKMLMAPMARASIKPASMNENPAEYTLDILLNTASKYPWGVAFALANEGYTDAEILEIHGVTFPHMAAWKADGTATKFDFHADRQAAATGKIHIVTVDGVADATVTKATSGVTPTAKPSANQIVVCFYEYAV